MKINSNRFFLRRLAIAIPGLILLLCHPYESLCQAIKTGIPGQPNIIYILADDLGVGDVGVFFQNKHHLADSTAPYIKTPHIDDMARRGVMLTNSYVNAPVCAPSRASLLTGLTQGHANVRDNQFDKALEDNYTLGNTLQQLGYTTVAIGKWGLQGLQADWPAHPLKRGFDYYYGYIRHSDGHEHYPKEGKYRKPKEVYENYTNVVDGLDKCYTGDLWTAKAKQWLINYRDSGSKAHPFFMYLAYDNPHAVLELPTQAYPAGSGKNGGLQWTGKPGHMINTASGEIDSWIDPMIAKATYDHDRNPATPEIPWPNVYQRYATVVQRLDRQVGDILQLLQDLGLDDNTMVVFTSDNGPSKESYLPEDFAPDFFKGFGDFDGIKRDVWEGGVRVPTIVQWPGKIQPGSVMKLPHMASDWMPTFLDMAGGNIPAKCDGVTLLPALTGKEGQQTPQVYVEYFVGGKTPSYKDFAPGRRGAVQQQMQSVRMGDFIGVRYHVQAPDQPFEIYNVEKDPGERNNLVAQMPELNQQMQAAVLQMRKADQDAKRPYDSSLIPAVKTLSLMPGISWKTYTGKFDWVPVARNMTSAGHGVATSVNKAIEKMGSSQFMVMDGCIKIPEDGEYQFDMAVNGKAFLRLHQIALLDADYHYVSGTTITAVLHLKAGMHPYKLSYLQSNTESAGVQLNIRSVSGQSAAFYTGQEH